MSSTSMVDESGAPWPYDELDVLGEPDRGPTWECPDGLCDCHPPRGLQERVDHRVTLFDHRAAKMPGARCRVLENGKLINLDAPFADGDGSVAVRIQSNTRTLQVEWAPADMPAGPRYPYRRAYYVDLGGDDREGVRRRLHNFGISSHENLPADIVEFQLTFGLEPTGQVEDVLAELRAFHDEAELPPIVNQIVDAARALAFADPSALGPTASAGSPAPSGSVAALHTTKVRIQLHQAFALFDDDFEPTDDVAWPDHSEAEKIVEPHQHHKYDPAGLLKTLYSTAARRAWRLGGGNENTHPIEGATLTFNSLGLPSTKHVTDARGAVVIQLPVTGDPHHITLEVEPPAGQLNATGQPAGPGLTDEKTDAPFLYRTFSLHIKVDDTGALFADDIVIIPGTRPKFVKVIDTSSSAPTGNRIRIDWRPDWMLSDERKRASARITDPQDTPINPFDKALPSETRREQAPPGIVIHQTGTHNLPFLSGFLSDSQVTNAHYLVDFDGFAIKLVDEHFKTNHAGASAWGQRASINQFTVGIETMHTDTIPFAPPPGASFVVKQRRFLKEQYDALIRICSALREEYPIHRMHVIGHMEERVTKATEKVTGQRSRVVNGILSRDRVGCPGDFFEWQRLEEAGVSLKRLFFPAIPPAFGPLQDIHQLLFNLLLGNVSIPADSQSDAVRMFKTLLFDIGYSVEKTPVPRDQLSDKFDTALVEAIRAFQTHHFSGRRRRYKVTGVIGAERSFPDAGTLDGETMRAIVEVWWAFQHEP